MAPALDLDLINQLGRDLHPYPDPNGLMHEEEVCPWTLFLTMALTLLKGDDDLCCYPRGRGG